MVRKQIYIKPEQNERIKRLSKVLGISEAELIRYAVDAYFSKGQLGAKKLNHQAWLEELEFIKSRPMGTGTGEERVWSREDAYEERSFGYRRQQRTQHSACS